jgi:hypothetical protein
MKKLLIILTAGLIAVTAQAQYNKVYHGGGFYHGGRWHSTHHGGGHWRQGVHIREPQQPVQATLKAENNAHEHVSLPCNGGVSGCANY